jgi:hypothetical protein
MATRKKHIRTPYEDERKKHRAAASRHVLVLEAQIKEDDKRKLFHIANDLRIYGNHLTNIAQKRVSQLFRTLHSRFQNLPGLPGDRSELNHSRRVWT